MPFGVIATPVGVDIAMVAVTVLVAVLITDTELLSELVM